MAAVALLAGSPPPPATPLHFLGDNHPFPKDSQLVREALPKQQVIAKDSLTSAGNWKDTLLNPENVADLVRGKFRAVVDTSGIAPAPTATVEQGFVAKTGGFDM